MKEDIGLQQNTETGSLRMAEAGEGYVYFLSPGMSFEQGYPGDLVKAAKETGADIAAANFTRTADDGARRFAAGVMTGYYDASLKSYDLHTCPDRILQTLSSDLCGKVFRREFLEEHGLTPGRIGGCWESILVPLAAAAGARICPRLECVCSVRGDEGAGRIAEPKSCGGSAEDSSPADREIDSVRRLLELSRGMADYEKISASVLTYAAKRLLELLPAPGQRTLGRSRGAAEDGTLTEEEKVCAFAHELFSGSEYDFDDCRVWDDDMTQLRFLAVRNCPPGRYRELASKKITVSFTSYPARIEKCASVVGNLLDQTLRPDRIVLYLWEGDFPGREGDLPRELRTLADDGTITLCWCGSDLRPHKKYFYAFRDFPDDIIVTVDDDLRYSRQLLEMLFLSYLAFPGAVSAVRAHWIMPDMSGHIAPYDQWLASCTGCLHEPSMRLLATGGAGALYPPHLLRCDLLSEELIRETAPAADDLLLKGLELVSGVPVVLACDDPRLRMIDGTQDEALWQTNVTENDRQMAAVTEWIDSVIGAGKSEDLIFSGKDRAGSEEPGTLRRLVANIERAEQRRSRAISFARNRALREREWFRLQSESAGCAPSPEDSVSYRIGRAATWLPRAIKRIIKKGD